MATVLGGVFKKDGIEQKVAIKCTFKKLLLDEAAILCQLTHSHIVKLIAITKSIFGIVLELIELGDLKSAIEVSNTFCFS